ncbi:hypothetical protein TsFJ059_008096, partial [Trichoderma semiorbis]
RTRTPRDPPSRPLIVQPQYPHEAGRRISASLAMHHCLYSYIRTSRLFRFQ